MAQAAYKRILLKISGEFLKKDTPDVIDHVACNDIAEAICAVYGLGVQIGIVVGGGNIFRGRLAKEFGFDRTPADHVGMLATAINGLILNQKLSTKGCKTRIMSAINFDGIIEAYNWSHALHSLDKGHIVIFVGGTGNPYFTTDTTAALRASEINAEVVFKATKVDGIYDKDPCEYPDAVMRDRITFLQAIAEKTRVMDHPAIVICRENGIPIHVFNFRKEGALLKAVVEKKGGTIICNDRKEDIHDNAG